MIYFGNKLTNNIDFYSELFIFIELINKDNWIINYFITIIQQIKQILILKNIFWKYVILVLETWHAIYNHFIKYS